MPSISYKIFSTVLARTPLKFNIFVLYFRRFKELPNLKMPTTFNEKIQYRKIHDRNPLLTIMADKLASKIYVQEKTDSVYIPRVLWEGISLESLYHEKLPSNFVIKANHGSQTNLFIKDNQLPPLHELEKLRQKWFSHDQARVLGEWAYANIPRKIFIEEFMEFEGSVPDDYKFFVFHGKVKLVQFDVGRFTNHQRSILDPEWNEYDLEYSYPKVTPLPPKPFFLDEMILAAEKIAEDIDFARVDLYWFDQKVTFGEITLYPGAGFEKFPDIFYDELFGSFW
ncbi:ATP-grasp fold amidoligase family protein [Symbiopectobacterium sp. RP]|uniref:ATP-grasp fold amidoligase family protein n=1 Tax=Symbiopectobacterium sp. RP TaxID=3248553 RepID=UPI003D296DBC